MKHEIQGGAWQEGQPGAAQVPQQRRAAPVPHFDPRRPDEGVQPTAGRRLRWARGTVTVVIPTLNEAKNIGWALSQMPEDVNEVVLVDGRSTDGTVEVARRVRPDIKVVLETRKGKGAALRAGFAAATGDYVVMIDADGSMHPHEIALYVAYLDAGYDFVKGSRFMLSGGSDDMTLVRKAGHWPLLSFVKWGWQVRITDLCYGFVAFRRSRLNILRLSADGFEIETELVVRAVRARLRIAEVPTWEHPRRYGESNLHAVRDGLRIARVLVRERFTPGRYPVGQVRPVEEHLVIDLLDRTESRVQEHDVALAPTAGGA
jgi:glycosyltransferase involved in cell wall biosynthesis